MGKWCKGWVMAMVISFQLFSSVAKAAELRDFLMSCAYGTAAGALVGLATLAFSEDPSKNFSNVAKGASLGLYAGIGMGLYMIYGETSSSAVATLSSGDLSVKSSPFIVEKTKKKDSASVLSIPTLAIIPHIKNSQVDGVNVQIQMLQF